MARYLVVANQTLGGEELLARLEELATEESCELRLLVPVTDTEGLQQWDYPPIDRVIPDAHRIATALAAGRLEHELARLARAGVTARGESLRQIRSRERRSCSARNSTTQSWSRHCRVDCLDGCSWTFPTGSPGCRMSR